MHGHSATDYMPFLALGLTQSEHFDTSHLTLLNHSQLLLGLSHEMLNQLIVFPVDLLVSTCNRWL